MTDSNPKLTQKLLTEVIFEIQFLPSEMDISLIIGNLFEKLRKDYSIFKNLNNDLPEGFPELNKIVRYRVFSEDNQNLYSLGKGILSVNTLNYISFEKYIEDIKKVVKLHKEITGIKSITRLGLRYINKIKNDSSSIEDKLNIKIDLPKILKENQLGVNLRTSNKFENGDFVNFALYTPEQFKNEEFLLDIDYSTESMVAYDLDNIVNWLNNSHEFIYKIFKECVSEKYFKQIS